jgi:hypothetical protein
MYAATILQRLERLRAHMQPTATSAAAAATSTATDTQQCLTPAQKQQFLEEVRSLRTPLSRPLTRSLSPLARSRSLSSPAGHAELDLTGLTTAPSRHKGYCIVPNFLDAQRFD